MKITRGRYALPITSRFGTRPPAPEVVIAQLNREGAQQLVSSGAAAAWNFLLPDRPAGQAIRALTWLGPDQALAALPTLRRLLPPVEWDALLSIRAERPLWLVELLERRERLSRSAQAPVSAVRHEPTQPSERPLIPARSSPNS